MHKQTPWTLSPSLPRPGTLLGRGLLSVAPRPGMGTGTEQGFTDGGRGDRALKRERGLARGEEGSGHPGRAPWAERAREPGICRADVSQGLGAGTEWEGWGRARR